MVDYRMNSHSVGGAIDYRHAPPPPPPPQQSHLGSRPRHTSASATNLCIATDRQTIRKIPIKTSSFQTLPRVRPIPADTRPIPPARSADRHRRNVFRAAEGGNRELLPTSVNCTPLRGRMFSSDSSTALKSVNSNSSVEQLKDMNTSLRSRRGLLARLDETTGKGTIPNRTSKPDWPPDMYQGRKSHRNELKIGKIFLDIRLGKCVRMLVMTAIFFFVWDSQRKASETTRRLDIFRQDEQKMMLHLERISQHAQGVQESLGRLNADGATRTERPHDPGASDGSELVNSKLAEEQIRVLTDMEEELNHELRALKLSLQQAARRAIVQNYGEGPVEVVLEFDFAGTSPAANKISILLWYDTPHAAWTWLQQIKKGIWDESLFKMEKTSLAALPTSSDEPRSTLEFVESSQKTHEPWTVGLTELEGNKLGMFINLRDNTELHKREVCVGKVIDGFDVLQKLVDMSRNSLDSAPLAVKRVTADHLTRSQTAGLI